MALQKLELMTNLAIVYMKEQYLMLAWLVLFYSRMYCSKHLKILLCIYLDLIFLACDILE